MHKLFRNEAGEAIQST